MELRVPTNAPTVQAYAMSNLFVKPLGHDASEGARAIYLYLATQCLGADKAVKSKHIEFRLGMANRKVRDCIKELRLQHHMDIGKGNGGYYIPETDEERVRWLTGLERHAKSELQIVAAGKRMRWKAYLETLFEKENGDGK